jgi:hypothetical protein
MVGSDGLGSRTSLSSHAPEPKSLAPPDPPPGKSRQENHGFHKKNGPPKDARRKILENKRETAWGVLEQFVKQEKNRVFNDREGKNPIPNLAPRKTRSKASVFNLFSLDVLLVQYPAFGSDAIHQFVPRLDERLGAFVLKLCGQCADIDAGGGEFR